MTITISRQAYFDLFTETVATWQHPDPTDVLDVVYKYPQELGRGYWRDIELQEGLWLTISNHQLHDRLIIAAPDRPHPLQYSFCLAGGVQGSVTNALAAGHYYFCGSGIAQGETWDCLNKQQLMISVHIEPELFLSLVGDQKELPKNLVHLMRPLDQVWSWRVGQTMPDMLAAVEQILYCPYEGVVKRLYLESKVMELMALLLAEESIANQGKQQTIHLKPEDHDRLHRAKDILMECLSNPPSLIELARQVGLNDRKLKEGFRQLFGTTVFGYLHVYRMEQARQLLQRNEITIEGVANAVGFRDRSYFAAAFRRKFGMNPRDYITLIRRK